MTPSDLLAHFGSQTAIARALGCSQPSVNEWFKDGSVPEGRQYQVQLATNGKLKADKPAARDAKKRRPAATAGQGVAHG